MSRSRSKMPPLSALLLLLAVKMLMLSSVLTEAALIAASNATSPPTAGSGNENIATTASSSLCDSQLLFQKLYVLMPAINQCAMESDYFIKPDNLSLPSQTSLDKFCSSKNCSELSVQLDNAGLPSCSVPVGNSTMQFKVFFKDIKSNCDNIAQVPEPAGGGASGASDVARVWHTTRAAVLILVALVVVGVL